MRNKSDVIGYEAAAVYRLLTVSAGSTGTQARRRAGWRTASYCNGMQLCLARVASTCCYPPSTLNPARHCTALYCPCRTVPTWQSGLTEPTSNSSAWAAGLWFAWLGLRQTHHLTPRSLTNCCPEGTR